MIRALLSSSILEREVIIIRICAFKVLGIILLLFRNIANLMMRR